MIKDDEISNEKRAELQSQQIDEKIALGRQLSRSRHSEETRIDEFYGLGREVLQTEIREITHRLQKPGLTGYLYRQIKGKDDSEALKRAKLSLDNLEMRVSERRQATTQREVSVQEQLVVEHDLQSNSLEVAIEMSKIDVGAIAPVSEGNKSDKNEILVGGHTIPIKLVKGGRYR